MNDKNNRSRMLPAIIGIVSFILGFLAAIYLAQYF